MPDSPRQAGHAPVPSRQHEAPDFSSVAAAYATARPGYPAGLFEWLASVTQRRELAWDTATGSGQAAVGLAEHFDRVVASDGSAAQVQHARRHPRVHYLVGRAEAPPLRAHAVDLIVAAAAVHWFNLPAFYEEVRRVARPGAVLAAWTYHVGHVEPPFDVVFWPFYRDVVGPYFAAGARLADERYDTLDLPGRPLSSPAFVVSARWTATKIIAFVRTWSGVQAFIKGTGRDPVAPLVPAIEELCRGDEEPVELRWPVYMRAVRL